MDHGTLEYVQALSSETDRDGGSTPFKPVDELERKEDFSGDGRLVALVRPRLRKRTYAFRSPFGETRSSRYQLAAYSPNTVHIWRVLRQSELDGQVGYKVYDRVVVRTSG
jgi:hypothetical protein